MTQIELNNLQEAFVIAYSFPVILAMALAMILFLFLAIGNLFHPPEAR